MAEQPTTYLKRIIIEATRPGGLDHTEWESVYEDDHDIFGRYTVHHKEAFQRPSASEVNLHLRGSGYTVTVEEEPYDQYKRLYAVLGEELAKKAYWALYSATPPDWQCLGDEAWSGYTDNEEDVV